jgi:hypothetical protein
MRLEPTGASGSCALRLGYRHSEYVLGDEEFQYGAASAGPAYFWPDDEKSPWILIVKSFWVRPCFPDRADMWEIDSGESYEVAYSDGAFAADRCFGYALSPWLDSWGRDGEPYDAVPTTAPDGDHASVARIHGSRQSRRGVVVRRRPE